MIDSNAPGVTQRMAYTVREAAEAIGRSRSFVLEAIRRGEIQATAVRHGVQGKRSAWIIPALELENWVRGGSL